MEVIEEGFGYIFLSNLISHRGSGSVNNKTISVQDIIRAENIGWKSSLKLCWKL